MIFKGIAPVIILFVSLLVSYVSFGNLSDRFDRDQDGFYSSSLPVRGTNWKGVDCDDKQGNSYPGQREDLSPEQDTNCNFIWGQVTPADIVPLKDSLDDKDKIGGSRETYFCDQSQSMGTVLFGDSIGAGFKMPIDYSKDDSGDEMLPSLRSLPPSWQSVRSVEEYKKYDRLNQPQRSYITGFHPDIEGRSIYRQMVGRNQCNLNDYQNLSQIGATSFDFMDQIKALSRTKQDKPILAFVGYVVNDVCADTLNKMTTEADFRRNMLQGLEHLNAKVAAGSKIVLIGLVSGNVLWDIMHNRRHPLGITYQRFYNTLAVNGSNPCRTWLTPLESVRNQATQRANALNQVLKSIAETTVWEKFEVAYLPFGLKTMMQNIESNGEAFHHLIQSVDGFHPRLSFHRLLADYIWQTLETNHPTFIGPINPFNQQIQLWREQ